MKAVALVALVSAAAAGAATVLAWAAGLEPAPSAAFAPVKFHPVPVSAVRVCEGAQRQSPHPILCPRRLPRSTLPWPDGTRREFRVREFRTLAGGPQPSEEKQIRAGVSFEYGIPVEPGLAAGGARTSGRTVPAA